MLANTDLQPFFDAIQRVLDTYPIQLHKDGLERLLVKTLTEALFPKEWIDSLWVEMNEQARGERRRSGVVTARVPGMDGAPNIEKVLSSAGWGA